jgi:hypothetical protein
VRFDRYALKREGYRFSKIVECVHSKQGHNPRVKKMEKSEIRFLFPSEMVSFIGGGNRSIRRRPTDLS